MNLSENIRNAFNVVLKTYENVNKLMQYCDFIAYDCGYEVITERFLRYKSDIDINGWYITSFVKLYRYKNDEDSGNIFVMDIYFGDIPTVYLSKFEFDNFNSKENISSSDYKIFSNPLYDDNDLFKDIKLDNEDRYFASVPVNEAIKTKYRGLKRVVYTSINLVELNSNNISEKIFGEFDTLKGL